MLEIDKRVARPELLLQFLTANQFTGTIQQHLQDGQGLTLQANTHPLFAQFPRVRVELEGAETYDARFCSTSHCYRYSFVTAKYISALARLTAISSRGGKHGQSMISGVTYISHQLH